MALPRLRVPARLGLGLGPGLAPGCGPASCVRHTQRRFVRVVVATAAAGGPVSQHPRRRAVTAAPPAPPRALSLRHRGAPLASGLPALPESLSSLHLPERLVIGDLTTAWEFHQIWMVPLAYFAVKPLLMAAFVCYRLATDRRVLTVDDYSQLYDRSQLRQLQAPLQLLWVPMAANYITSNLLNTAFTYKLLKVGVLKKLAAICIKANYFTYLAWTAVAVMKLKTRYLIAAFQKTARGRRMMPAVDKIMSISIILFIIAAGLQVVGLKAESLGLAGLASVTFALGAQSTLSQFLAGLVLCNPESPFSVGDFIILEGAEGTVAHIGYFNTTLITPDTTPVIFPNSKLVDAKVLNISSNMARRMVEEFVAIPETYQDANKALDDIRGMMSISPFVYKKMPYRCHIWGFKGKGILIRMECYFDAPGTNPMCRDIELENRHSLCLEVMKILERNNCRLGAYDMNVALPGALPGVEEMSMGFEPDNSRPTPDLNGNSSQSMMRT
eukprot:jgi/Tetstr1/457843/TSEL_044388.t1